MHKKKIILGVTGGIAAYKAAELLRLLVKIRCRAARSDDAGGLRVYTTADFPGFEWA